MAELQKKGAKADLLRAIWLRHDPTINKQASVTLSGETLAREISVGRNYLSGEIFYLKPDGRKPILEALATSV